MFIQHVNDDVWLKSLRVISMHTSVWLRQGTRKAYEDLDGEQGTGKGDNWWRF